MGSPLSVRRPSYARTTARETPPSLTPPSSRRYRRFMRLRSTYLSLSLTVLCSFGCSSSGGGGTIFSPGADLAGVTGPSPGGFSLTVQQAQIESSLQGTMPASGREFLDLSVQLQNDSQPTSIVANPAFFTVETASALQVSASASTSLAMPPCRSDLAVAAGGRLLCDLVFE